MRMTLLVLLALLVQSTAFAANPPPTPDYLRFAEDRHSARLEVAVKSFTLPSGQIVDLVGAVHVADDAYYELLNQRFERYDSVLFELVGDPAHLKRTAPEIMKQQADRPNQGAITTVQQSMSRFLNLSYQIGAIDYTKRNMVHADASLEEFARMQQERGENMLTLFVRAMNAQMSSGAQAAAMNELNTFALIRMLMSPDSATEFKKALAKVFDQSESMTAAMEGQGGSAILSGRNDVAVRKLKEVLADRRKQRHVAVFYGGAHLPGIETILLSEMQAKPAGEEWLAAWTMPAPVSTAPRQ